MGQTRRPPSMAREQHWPVTVVQKRGPTHIIMAAAPPAPSNISIEQSTACRDSSKNIMIYKDNIT